MQRMLSGWEHVQESSVVQHEQHKYEETSVTSVSTQISMQGPDMKPLVKGIFRTLPNI